MGKTKNVYELENGHYMLEFKDDVTGTDGVFDPGANTVGLKMEGAGAAGLRLTKFFFEAFRRRGIATHYVDADLEKQTMEVLPANVFGKGLEVICRYKAVGSFLRRYGQYVDEADDLHGYVEITIKDDDAGDPLITKEGLVLLNIMTEEEYDEIVEKTKEIAGIVKEILKEKELDLYDIKLEFGRDRKTGQVLLIDEISGGNMRVYRGNEVLLPLDLPDLVI